MIGMTAIQKMNYRTEQFKDCLLNTVIRKAQPFYEKGSLTRATCWEDMDFLKYAEIRLKNDKIFLEPVEPAMENARMGLLSTIHGKLMYWETT